MFVNNFQKYKTYRVFGPISELPEHLRKTGLEGNYPFVLISMMNCVYAPDLSEQLFDYSKDEPALLQLSMHDLEKYFVPCEVTTIVNQHARFEYRLTMDKINNLGGPEAVQKRLENENMMHADRVYLNAMMSAFYQFQSEYFGVKNGC